jgi:hypothetical protein
MQKGNSPHPVMGYKTQQVKLMEGEKGTFAQIAQQVSGVWSFKLLLIVKRLSSQSLPWQLLF